MKVNKGFLKKIPDNAEAALVLEGKLPGKWLVAGMHGEAFFCFGAGWGGARQKRYFFRVGRGWGKILGRGRATAKLGAFSERGNLENFWSQGSPGQFSSWGRSGACLPGWL